MLSYFYTLVVLYISFLNQVLNKEIAKFETTVHDFGEILFESEKNIGTIVTIRIPLIDESMVLLDE